MKAWHFLAENKKLGYKDGRLVRVGHTFKCDPDSLVMCKSGFHATKRLFDALKYAPGPVVCRVELGGRILHQDDKSVASERTVIAMADASTVLHEFACWCEEQALKNIKNPDPRSVAAIAATRAWRESEITDAELLAAAGLAADRSAWLAAGSAADRSAADRSAAWLAARSAQNEQLTKMVNKLLKQEH